MSARFEPPIPEPEQRGYTGTVIGEQTEEILGYIEFRPLVNAHRFTPVGGRKFGQIAAQQIADALKKADALL